MPRNSSTSSSSELRRFGLKLLALAAVALVVDRAGGALAQYLFFRTTDGDTGGQVNGLRAAHSDIVVFGSSRAESHYIPEILGASLGASAFNAGFKGSNTLYDYGVEQLVFDAYTPKLLIYDFSAFAVARSKADPYTRLSPLYPYWRNPHIWRLIQQGGSHHDWYFWSRLYPYNSKLHSLLLFNVLKTRPGASQGYVAQGSVMPDHPPATLEWSEARYDPRLVLHLQRFIEAAHAHGVKMVVVLSPHYSLGTYALPASVQRLLQQDGIPVMDFNMRDYPQFADHRLFRDESHLNDQGAHVFSQLLGQQLRELRYVSEALAAPGAASN